MGATYRLLAANDVAAVERLIASHAGAAPYAALGTYFLSRVVVADRASVPDVEAQAIVAAVGEQIVGAGMFGFVAGAVDSGRIIHVAVAEEHAIAVTRGLVDRMSAALFGAGARCITAEVPDDAAHAAGRAALEATRYQLVGRIDDYYREGTAMLLLRCGRAHVP